MDKIIFTVYTRRDGSINEQRAVQDLTTALRDGRITRRECVAICRAIKKKRPVRSASKLNRSRLCDIVQ